MLKSNFYAPILKI